MKGKIAIEPALTNVRNYLTENGYDVESMTDLSGQSSRDLRGYDAIVVTGMSKIFLAFRIPKLKPL